MKHGEKERQIGKNASTSYGKNATTTMYTFAQKRPPMRQAGTGGKATRATDVEAAGHEGESLPSEVRRYFEPRFGWDFSKVRIHADSDAARDAQAIQARAYTLGRDIVFGAGEYTPATNEGRRLIAHELAHVVQQEGGFPTGQASGATLSAKADADYEAAVKAEAGKKAQQQGGGSGSAVPTPQRKAILGAVIDPLEQEADVIAERVMRMEQPVPDFVPALDHALLLGPISNDRASAVRRDTKDIRPKDVAVEMVGQKFHLRKSFTTGAINVPVGEIVTVTSWDNASSTVEVTSPSVKDSKDSYHVPKYLLEPKREPAEGIAPYDVGLGKQKTIVEGDAADVAAWKEEESNYKKNKAYFKKQLSDRTKKQADDEKPLNVLLIQATMLNRFDTSIKKWVDHYNDQFHFKGKDALDPNLIKAMAFQESQMGTNLDKKNIEVGLPKKLVWNRFNILQATDSPGEELVPMIQEIRLDLYTNYHLYDVMNDFKKMENELDDLRKEEKSNKALHKALPPKQKARLNKLEALSNPGDNWQKFFYTNQNFVDALKEFLNSTRDGKKLSENYDFWIQTGVRAVFEKHKTRPDWAEAARAFNGGGEKAENYHNFVLERAEEAVKAEAAGKEYVPHDPDL